MLTLAAHTEPGHTFLTRAGAVPKLTTIIQQGNSQRTGLGGLREWEDAAKRSGLEWERYAGRVPRERLLCATA